MVILFEGINPTGFKRLFRILSLQGSRRDPIIGHEKDSV